MASLSTQFKFFLHATNMSPLKYRRAQQVDLLYARHGSTPLSPGLTPHRSSVPINPISEPSSYTVQPPCPGFFIQDLFIAHISPPLSYFLTHPSFPLDCEFTGGIKYKFSRSLLSAQGWYPVGAYDMPVAWKDNGVRWDGVLFPSNSNNLRLFPVHVWGTTVPERPIVPTENTKM